MKHFKLLSIKTLFFIGFCIFSLCPVTFTNEIIDEKFTILYETPELKYFAYQTKETLIVNIKKTEQISGIKFNRKFLVTLSLNSDSLLQNRTIDNQKLITPDTASSLNIFFTPPNNYHSNLPYQQFIFKKLLYILFRQNGIHENIYWEEALFEFCINDIYGLGLISLSNLEINPIFMGKNVEELPYQETIESLPFTNQNINAILQRIQLAKTLLLNKRKIVYKDTSFAKISLRSYLQKVNETNFPSNFLTNSHTSLINTLQRKRTLYAKIMENFNNPTKSTTENITQNYVFRMILRLLLQKQQSLAALLFHQIVITPPNTPYFPELGLYFAHQKKEKKILFLEYYLINQQIKRPIDFDDANQVSILLQETLAEEMPDFGVNNKELDTIRTLQFLLYTGQPTLALDLIKLEQKKISSLDTKNYLWAIGILLNDKKTKAELEQNIDFYKTFIWQETLNDY